MASDFEQKFKETLDFLDSSDIDSPNKPAIPHLKRVGEYLYEKGMSGEVVRAGILHDMLEWSSVSEQELEEKFGTRLLQLIKANSKDKNINDKHQRRVETVKRCQEIGDDALAIKIADTFDSFKYYCEMGNEKELERCREFVGLLMENLSEKLKETFWEDLLEINRI